MFALLQKIFLFFQKSFLKNILLGAGLMIASSVSIMAAFTVAYQSLLTSYSGVSADVLGLAHVAGLDTAITIILSAIVTKIGLNATKLGIKKAS